MIMNYLGLPKEVPLILIVRPVPEIFLSFPPYPSISSSLSVRLRAIEGIGKCEKEVEATREPSLLWMMRGD